MKPPRDDKLVHGGGPWTIIRCPWTTRSSYTRRTNTQHLENFRLSVAVTKPIAIAMNPSNEITSVSGYNLVAVQEVNSGLMGFHKFWGGYWTNNRTQNLYIKDRSELEKGKNISETSLPKTWNFIPVRLTSPSEGVWPVFFGPLFDCTYFL